MTATTGAGLRLLCFGDPEGTLCGAVLEAGDAGALIRGPSGDATWAGRDAARIEVAGEAWQVAGDGVQLEIMPVAAPSSEGGQAGDELCEVTGRIRIDGDEQSINCLGTRSQDPGPALAGAGSLRAVAGWFPDRRALSLRAVRPAGNSGHEGDHLTATLFDSEAWLHVADPRLSTTFKADQQPDRTSLELWVGDGDQLYPRRAAGEATGTPLAASTERITMTLTPLRCHAAGQDGAGVYLLAQF